MLIFRRQFSVFSLQQSAVSFQQQPSPIDSREEHLVLADPGGELPPGHQVPLLGSGSGQGQVPVPLLLILIQPMGESSKTLVHHAG